MQAVFGCVCRVRSLLNGLRTCARSGEGDLTLLGWRLRPSEGGGWARWARAGRGGGAGFCGGRPASERHCTSPNTNPNPLHKDSIPCSPSFPSHYSKTFPSQPQLTQSTTQQCLRLPLRPRLSLPSSLKLLSWLSQSSQFSWTPRRSTSTPKRRSMESSCVSTLDTVQ